MFPTDNAHSPPLVARGEVLLLMWWWSLMAFAGQPVTWDSVTSEAIAAWSDGPGAEHAAMVQGAQEAGRRVAIGPVAIRAEAQVGVADQRQVLTALEVPLSIGQRERKWWSSVVEARQARGDSAQWAWVQQVHIVWLDWWTATEIGHHLEEYAADVEDDLAGFQLAVDEGLLAPIALEDLRAESLQVRAEAAAMEQRVQVAAARLQTLLGERPLEAGGHDLHDADPRGDNPWLGMSAQAGALPAVREAKATAEAERRRAAALTAERAPSLEVGPMWAPGPDGRMVPLGFIGVRVPLQPGVSSQRRDALAGASAAEAARAWKERELAGHLREEAVGWDATRARLLRLQTEVVGPLASRQARLELALAEGLVTADRVVRARRERHEAEHEQVLVAGELLASEARAELVRKFMAGEGQ